MASNLYSGYIWFQQSWNASNTISQTPQPLNTLPTLITSLARQVRARWALRSLKWSSDRKWWTKLNTLGGQRAVSRPKLLNHWDLLLCKSQYSNFLKLLPKDPFSVRVLFHFEAGHAGLRDRLTAWNRFRFISCLIIWSQKQTVICFFTIFSSCTACQLISFDWLTLTISDYWLIPLSLIHRNSQCCNSQELCPPLCNHQKGQRTSGIPSPKQSFPPSSSVLNNTGQSSSASVLSREQQKGWNNLLLPSSLSKLHEGIRILFKIIHSSYHPLLLPITTDDSHQASPGIISSLSIIL